MKFNFMWIVVIYTFETRCFIMQKFDASALMIKGFDWSPCIKIRAEINVKLSKALVALSFFIISFFWVSSVRGITIFE